jgi:hypothetical protein
VSRRRASLALLTLLGLDLFLFQDVLFRGRVFFYGDLTAAVYPWIEALVRIVLSGSPPLWNPDVSFGQPLWATPHYLVLYPFTWLSFFMSRWSYLTLFVVAHVLFAGLGFYWLARRLRLAVPAAFLAAAVWMLSGPFLSLDNVPNHLAGAAWLPWTVGALVGAIRTGRLTAWVFWGMGLAMPILAASPEGALMGGFFSALYAASRLRWRRLVTRATGRLAGALVAGGLFALLLSAGQWLPTLEAAKQATRWGMTPDEQQRWSAPPLTLVQVAVPVFFDGLPLDPGWRAKLCTPGRNFLLSVYCGLPALMLALVGVVRSRGRLRWWLLGGALLAAGLALGNHGFVYQVALALVPPLRLLRYPVKAMVAVAFALALLVGLGTQILLRLRAQRRQVLNRILIGYALGLGACGALALMLLAPGHWSAAFLAGDARSLQVSLAPAQWQMKLSLSLAVVAVIAAWTVRRAGARRWAVLLLATAVIVDLLLTHRALSPTAPWALARFRPPVVDVVGDHPQARVHVVDRPAPEGVRPLSAMPWAAAVEAQSYLMPITATLYGLSGSYESDLVGFYTRPLLQLTGMARGLEGSPDGLRLLRLGAVDYVVTHHSPSFQGLPPVATLSSVYPDAVRVFRVPDPLPRVYAVARARLSADDDALGILRDPTFDPRREVVLPPGTALIPAGDVEAAFEVLERRADRVRVAATLSAAAYVVFVESHDANWRAAVDGRPEPVLRANLAFRAVSVPAGRHVIECAYRPRSVPAGLACSLAALVGAGLLVWRDQARRVTAQVEAPQGTARA